MTEGKRKGRILCLVPAAMALVCYGLCVCFGGMMYQTNDDTSIQNTLSGMITGSPFPVHQFIHILISYPLSRLYKYIPSVQWWFVYSHFLMLTGLTVINCSLWRYAEDNRYPRVLAVLFTAILDAVFFIYPISYIGYTTVAGVTGAGAAALLTLKRGRHQPVRIAAAVILYVLAFCHRSNSGEVAGCFILLAILYGCLNPQTEGVGLSLPAPGNERENLKNLIRRLIPFGIAAVLLIGGTAVLTNWNQSFQERLNGQEFVRFNSARSAYMDYPKDSFEDNPRIYQDVGWDETTYHLVKSWCFMDENVTTEHFLYLVENSRTERKTTDLATLRSRWDQLQQYSPVVSVELAWLIICVGCLVSICLHFDKRALLFWVLNCLGTAVLVCYQLYTGRILYRTTVICLLPSTVFNLAVFFERFGRTNRKKTRRIVSALMILACIPWAIQSVNTAFDTAEKARLIRSEEKDIALAEYAASHEDVIFIKQGSLTSNRSPAKRVMTGKASNLIGWGGSTTYSRIYRIQLTGNGIKKLSGELMENKNVRFVSKAKITNAKGKGRKIAETHGLVLFYKWLRDRHGAKGIVLEDTVCDGIYIYRFLFSAPQQGEQAYDYTDGKFVLIQ